MKITTARFITEDKLGKYVRASPTLKNPDGSRKSLYRCMFETDRGAVYGELCRDPEAPFDYTAFVIKNPLIRQRENKIIGPLDIGKDDYYLDIPDDTFIVIEKRQGRGWKTARSGVTLFGSEDEVEIDAPCPEKHLRPKRRRYDDFTLK